MTAPPLPPGTPPAAAPQGRRVAGMIWLSVLPLVVNAFSTLASFIIIPGLGEIGWGIWSTALGLSGATSFIAWLGIRPLFIRALARSVDHAERNRLIGTQVAIRVLLAVVAGAVSLAVGVLVGYDQVTLTCAAIAALGLVPTVIWTVYSDVLNAQEEFRASALASLLSGLLLTLATVAVVLLGFGPIGVALAYLVGPTLTMMQLGVLLRRRGLRLGPSFQVAELRHVAREARVTATGDGLSALLTRLSGIYIPAIVGTTQYGYFATGTLLGSRLQVVSDAVSTAYNPELSREAVSLRAGRSTWASRTLLRLLLLSGTLIGVVTMAVSGWFVALLYRGDAAAGAREAATLVMAVTSGYLPLAVIAAGWRQLLVAVDHHDRAAKAAALASLIGALVAVALTWQLGVLGAAMGLVGSGAVSAALLGTAARRVAGAAAGIPGWLRALGSWLAGMALALLAVREGATLPGLLLGGAAPLVTLGGFVVSGLLTREELLLLAAKLAPRRGRGAPAP